MQYQGCDGPSSALAHQLPRLASSTSLSLHISYQMIFVLICC